MVSALLLQSRLALKQKKRSNSLHSITLLGTEQGRSDVQCTVTDDNGLISSAYRANLHSQGPLLIKWVQHVQNYHVCSNAAEERFRWPRCYPSRSPSCLSRCGFAAGFAYSLDWQFLHHPSCRPCAISPKNETKLPPRAQCLLLITAYRFRVTYVDPPGTGMVIRGGPWAEGGPAASSPGLTPRPRAPSALTGAGRVFAPAQAVLFCTRTPAQENRFFIQTRKWFCM